MNVGTGVLCAIFIFDGQCRDCLARVQLGRGTIIGEDGNTAGEFVDDVDIVTVGREDAMTRSCTGLYGYLMRLDILFCFEVELIGVDLVQTEVGYQDVLAAWIKDNRVWMRTLLAICA